MSTIEKIKIEIQKLSEKEQEKVLEFISGIEEDNEWKNFSLNSAMKGIENDGMDIYEQPLEFWNNDIDDKTWNNA